MTMREDCCRPLCWVAFVTVVVENSNQREERFIKAHSPEVFDP